MMKIKRQNKLGTYLAVTAGVGCAVSVADGEIVVMDLSGVSAVPGYDINFSQSDTDATGFLMGFSSTNGYLKAIDAGLFYSDVTNMTDTFAGAYNGVTDAAFPSDPDTLALWRLSSGLESDYFIVGLNWLAFKDGYDNFGWFSFTLDSFNTNSDSPISSFGHFIFDDSSTSPETAISLGSAIAAVPEPSSLALLALGAAGLISRRQRKAA